MFLTELPLGLAGKIFQSPIPFGKYDPRGSVYEEFKKNDISVIVLLASVSECVEKASKNLPDLYREDGFQIIHLPIPDYSVPPKDDLLNALSKTIENAQKGHNIVIHCSGGIGRTGSFAACLARSILGLSGDDAIKWVRKVIPGAVETSEQIQTVMSNCPSTHLGRETEHKYFCLNCDGTKLIVEGKWIYCSECDFCIPFSEYDKMKEMLYG